MRSSKKEASQVEELKIEVVIRMVDPTTGRKRSMVVDPNYKVPRIFAHHLLHETILNRAQRFCKTVLDRLERSE